jgi:hypothetical protein
MDLHQVLLGILIALVLMKAEAFDLIQVDQSFPHRQPMVLGQLMVVLLVHHLLLLVLELFTDNNSLSRGGRRYKRTEFINQYHVL